jgi:hypothetical protein
MITKSVGKTTLALVEDVNRQFLSWWKAQTSLIEGDLFQFQLMFHQKMVPPNNLVMFIPIKIIVLHSFQWQEFEEEKNGLTNDYSNAKSCHEFCKVNPIVCHSVVFFVI